MTCRRSKSLLTVLAMLVMASSLLAQAEKQPAASPTALAPSLQAALEQKEKAGWEAFKNKDKKAFADLVTSDYTAVLADGKGEHSRQATLDAMADITITDYSLSNFRLTSLGPNSAMLSYAAAAKYSINGQNQDGKLAVTDVWVKRGGQWKSLRYHETEVK